MPKLHGRNRFRRPIIQTPLDLSLFKKLQGCNSLRVTTLQILVVTYIYSFMVKKNDGLHPYKHKNTKPSMAIRCTFLPESRHSLSICKYRVV